MRLWRRGNLEEQLDKELLFHLEQHTHDLIAQGLDPADARRRARMELGGPEQVKERCRDERRARWLEDFWQDFRYAVRVFRQRPGFVAVALLTLALGCGATTVMFTLIDGVLFKPLPFPDPGRLLSIEEETEQATAYGNRWAFSYPNFVDCRSEVRSADIAGARYGGGTVSAPGDPEYVDGRQISANFLSVFGASLLRGRDFLPEDDRPGAPAVAIVSSSFSQHHPGDQIVFEGKPYSVVGVLSDRTRLPGDPVDIFTPIGQNTAPYMQRRLAHPGIEVFARLRPGATHTQAGEELTLVGRRLAQQFPESNRGRHFVAEQLQVDVSGVRSTLWLLLGAVALVLLIACVNLASLLLARAISRDRELAMRMALGASRGRLVRQCLTESAVLAVSGGALGIALAAIGLRPFVAFWPGSLPRAADVHLDWRVLLFALGISLFCGFLFGLAPAFRRPSVRSVRTGSRRLHGGFVISEIALAVVLLVSAGMLGRTLLRLSSLDPGMNVRNILVARVALSPGALTTPAHIRATWDDLLARIRQVPGVQSVATVDTVPMRRGDNQLGFSPTAVTSSDRLPLALATSVTPEYLNVMGMSLRRGRFFNDRDRLNSTPVVVIDEVMARQAFGTVDAVGKRLWIPDAAVVPYEVIGVVGHVRNWGFAGDDDAKVRAQFYYPFAQVPDGLVRRWTELMSVAVRTTTPPLTVLEALRKQVRGVAGDQVLYEVRTMEQLARGTLDRQRFLFLLFGIFAGLALLLACVGIYGVLAYLTTQRVPEIGVRMALGATARDILQLVMRQSMLLIFTGVAIGAIGAFAAARLLKQLVEGMSPGEPLTFAAMIAVLVAAALLASLIPARRASRVDPLNALRQE